MNFTRIATEEAFATPELFESYGALLDDPSLDDPGFVSLWGHYLRSEAKRPASVRRKLLDLDAERLADMDDTGIGRQIL